MAGSCDLCGKGPQMGRNIRLKARSSKWVRRAPRTPKLFMPNIQRATLTIKGVRKQLNVCTRCLRTMTKNA